MLARAQYYARRRMRHERRSMAVFESKDTPGTFRVAPAQPENDTEWTPDDLWTKVDELVYVPKNVPKFSERPHWFMARLWQQNPTNRKRRKKTPDGRRSCYYDQDPCVYCGNVPKKPSTEHAIPKSHGGPGGWENRVNACYRCNTYRNNWPMLLWLWALQKYGSPKEAARALGAQFPDRSVLRPKTNSLDNEAPELVISMVEVNDDEAGSEGESGEDVRCTYGDADAERPVSHVH